MRSTARLAARVGVSVAAMVAAVLALEAVARIADLPARPFIYAAPSNCLRRSAQLGMEFLPNCEATWSEGPLSGKASTTFHTNALGLRDADIEENGAVRILAIGDSCTWGWQVDQHETYPQRLQMFLDLLYGPGAYRVINAGIPGYTSYQGLLYLRDFGLRLHPAIVLIGYGFNDSTRAPDVVEALARQRSLLPAIRIDDFLLAHSRLWRWLRTRFTPESPGPRRGSAAQAAMPAAAYAEQEEPPVQVSPPKFAANLTAMVELSRQHGAKPLLVNFVGSMKPERPYAETMRAVASALDVPLVVSDGPRIDLIHPTRAGYARLAGAVLAALQHAGYVAPRPDSAPAAGDSPAAVGGHARF